MSRAKSILVQAEVRPEINSPHIFVGSQLIRSSAFENYSIRDDVSPISNAQRFTNIVIRDEHSNPARLEMKNDLLNIGDRDRIDAGKWFVEQDETR